MAEKVTRILGAVDGTGPFVDATYEAGFKNSFVNKIQNEPIFDIVGYSRGPSADGLRTDNLGSEMSKFILSKKQGLKEFQIFLTGYSRGGAAVIHAASLLQKEGVLVDAMFLFDAVDRTVENNPTGVIPANVKNCYHAIRSSLTNSRVSFGNTGRSLPGQHVVGYCTLRGNHLATPQTNYVEREFFGTHGALGGLPQVEKNAADKISEGGTTDYWSVQYLLTGPFINAGLRKFTQTQVTSHQNQQTANEVWRWMSGNAYQHLRPAGLLGVPTHSGKVYA